VLGTEQRTHQNPNPTVVEPLSAVCSLPEAELGLPDLVGGESYEWAAIDNLDAFFTRIYRWVVWKATWWCGWLQLL
jgi:hypothetical protein